MRSFHFASGRFKKKSFLRTIRIGKGDYLVSVNGRAERKQKSLGESKERQRTVKNNTSKWKRSGQKNAYKAVGRTNTVKM